MKSIILLSFLLLPGIYGQCQSSSIADDTLLLKITVTDYEDKKLETAVNIENKATHKIFNCKTNKDGRGECKLPVGESYLIKIPQSGDSYDYVIPEYAASPASFSFKFHIEKIEAPVPEAIRSEPLKAMIGLRIVNDNALRKLRLPAQPMFFPAVAFFH